MLNSIIHTWWHFIMPFVQYWLLHGMQTTANTPSTKHTHTHTRICIRKKNNIHTNLIKPLVSKFKCIQNISPFLHSLCVYLRVCLPFVWVWSGFFRSFFFCWPNTIGKNGTKIENDDNTNSSSSSNNNNSIQRGSL